MTEAILCLAGLVVWAFILFRPSVRKQPACLAPWPVSFSDFLACALFVVSGAFLLPLLVGIIVEWLSHRMPIGTDARRLVFGAATHLGAIVGAIGAWAYLRLQPRRATKPGQLDPTQNQIERPSPTNTFPWPLAGVLTFFAVLPVTLLSTMACYLIFQFLRLPMEPQETIEILVRLKSRALIVLFFALATVIAPIMEELVFRAGLFRYLRTRIPRSLAFLLPALLFAELHVGWKTLSGLNSLVPLVLLATVFSLAYERTGRIGVTMIAHALFNLNTILLIMAGMPT